MDNSSVSIAIGIALLTALLLHYLCKSSHRRINLHKLPELPGSRLFIGHLHLLGGRNLPHITLGALADEYGPIFTIRQGRHKSIVVSSSEIAKEIFTTHDRVFASRPHSTAFKNLGYDYAMFGVSPYGPYWRELRKISSNGLLSNSRLELLRHVWDSEINMSLKELYEVWQIKNLEDTRAAVVVDMKKWFSDLTLNMSVRMFAGKRYFGATNAVFKHIVTLVSGASDTTMVTLVWALSLLLNNQHVLKKAHNELDIHVGKERQVHESDLKNLTYLQAILKETLRLYPAGPLGGMREAIEDCILDGYHVPAGTRLLVNLWKIQRDPMVWLDPMEFKPERFLTIHVDIDVQEQNFELIPFGSGRRGCPGTSLALQVMHLTLARLIHEFDFETVSGEPVDMTESVGVTNAKATPLKVVLTPRHPT